MTNINFNIFTAIRNLLKYSLKNPPPQVILHRRAFVCLCRQIISPIYITFSIRFILCQIWITYINFKTFEEYLRELDLGQTYRQTNQMHTHFSTLLESVKKTITC